MLIRTIVLIAIPVSLTLAGCATQTPSSPHEHPSAPSVMTMSAAAGKLTIFPTRRWRPTYPRAASSHGIQGCVNVQFYVDAAGRPIGMQAAASQPRGVFDRAAIHAISHWRFSVTDESGRHVPTYDYVSQVIVFVLNNGGGAGSLVRWICDQPVGRTLIVARAPLPASHPIRVTSKDKKRVDVVRFPVAQATALPNGWVDIHFCVGRQGEVTHAKVRDSSPPGLYDDVALAALNTWDFEARKVLGHAVKTCGMSVHVPVYGADFLEKAPAILNHGPTALRKTDLGLNGDRIPKSGRVTMAFCIEPDGSVDHEKVIQSKPAAVFNRAAIKVLHMWQYWPRTVNGKPIATCNVQATIRFRNTRNRLLWAESERPD